MGMTHGMEWGGIDQMSPLKPEPTDYVRGMPGNETSRRGAITMDRGCGNDVRRYTD